MVIYPHRMEPQNQKKDCNISFLLIDVVKYLRKNVLIEKLQGNKDNG